VVSDVAHPQVMAAHLAATVTAVPSLWPEPWGQVAAEAAVCGRPVVASAGGGLGELVRDGETGLLVPPGDPVALAAALDRVVADPELAARLGSAGRARSAGLTVSGVAGRIEAVFERLIDGHEQGRRP
jgi:glycosyltransferase involved in cell wall biosynthesis